MLEKTSSVSEIKIKSPFKWHKVA